MLVGVTDIERNAESMRNKNGKEEDTMVNYFSLGHRWTNGKAPTERLNGSE